MSGGWLPKRNVFGNLEGAVQRGRGGKEKEWTGCVQSDIRAFGITGDWKATALKAEVYVCMYVCMVITYSRVWINRVRSVEARK